MKGKKVSNYELFFDLVFILATSGVVGILHSTPEHIVSFERILSFVVSTLSIWHIWLFENSKTVKPSWSFPHLVERMQLITILTVGELVIAIIKTYPLSEHFLLSILTFVMVGFLFVSYVYQTAIRMNHHQEVAAAPLVYLHIAILIAINIITAGVEMYYEGQLLNIGVSMILIGITVFYLCLYGTTRYNKEEVQLTKGIIKAYILIYLICTTLAIIFNRNTEIFYLALAIQAVLMVFISVDYRREED